MQTNDQRQHAYMLWIGLFLFLTSQLWNATQSNIIFYLLLLTNLLLLVLTYKSSYPKLNNTIFYITVVSLVLYSYILNTYKIRCPTNLQPYMVKMEEMVVNEIQPVIGKNGNCSSYLLSAILLQSNIKVTIRSKHLLRLDHNKKIFIYAKIFPRGKSSNYASIKSICFSSEKKTVFNLLKFKWALLRYKIKEKMFKKIGETVDDKECLYFILSTIFGFKPTKKISTQCLVSGISHILVVSGFHFTCVFNMAKLVSKLLVNKLEKFITTSICLCYFLILGPTYPSTRSFICAMLSIISECLNRPYNCAQAIGIAMLIQISMDPSCIDSVSFVLTYISSIALILFSHDIKKILGEKSFSMWGKYKNFVLDGACTSISTQVLILPIEISLWGKVHASSILANTFLTPILPVIIKMCIPAIFLSFANVWLGKVLFFPVIKLLKIFLFLLSNFSENSIQIELSMMKYQNNVSVFSIFIVCIWYVYKLSK